MVYEAIIHWIVPRLTTQIPDLTDTGSLIANFDTTCEAGMMCCTVENPFIEQRIMVTVCPNSMRKQVFDAGAGPFWRFLRHGHVEPAEIFLNLR